MRTCLFTGETMSPATREEHTIGDRPAGLRARLHQVPLRSGSDGGIPGSGAGGAEAQMMTVGTP